jgi:hypothetical protein
LRQRKVLRVVRVTGEGVVFLLNRAVFVRAIKKEEGAILDWCVVFHRCRNLRLIKDPLLIKNLILMRILSQTGIIRVRVSGLQ